MSVAIIIFKRAVSIGAWQDSNHVRQPQHTTPSCLASYAVPKKAHWGQNTGPSVPNINCHH